MSSVPPQSSPPATPGRPRFGGAWAVVAGLILLVGLGLLVQRGAGRALEGSWDFTMIYGGARQVALGGDPYDFASTFDAYKNAGGEVAREIGDRGRLRDPTWFHSLYPPTAYTLLSPIGTLRWDSARSAWLVLNLLATAAIAVWLVRQRPRPGPRNTDAQPREVSEWAAGAIAIGLWWGSASLHTALAFGQLSVLVLALMLPAIGWRSGPGSGSPGRGYAALAGLLLAIAGWLKPQLVGPIAVVLCVTPRRVIVAWAAGWGVLILVGSVVWMNNIAPGWVEHWRENLRAFTASGLAEPSALNPYTYQLIHLEPWLHRWWPDGIGPGGALRAIGLLLPVAVWLGMTVSLGFGDRAKPQRAEEARGLSRPAAAIALAAVLTLLMGYHRTYDAVLLVLPGVWAWRALSASRRDLAAWGVLIGVALFIVPGPVALEVWSRGDGFAAWLGETWVWRVLLLPHHSVALLVMAGCLIVRVVRPGPSAAAMTAGQAEKTGRSR